MSNVATASFYFCVFFVRAEYTPEYLNFLCIDFQLESDTGAQAKSLTQSMLVYEHIVRLKPDIDDKFMCFGLPCS